VIGNIHDLIAAVGACRRRGYAIQSAEQSVFNALMILRFMHDDAMTSAPQFDQTTVRVWRKARAANRQIVTPQRQEERGRFASVVDKVIGMTFSALPQALIETIGAAGAVLTTVCWVPQATKIIRERDTRAISLPGTTLCVIGVLLWLVYGLAIVDGPLIGSSVITLAITSIILVLKIRHG
jgi:MtN3 and saliva related transmembrane protein